MAEPVIHREEVVGLLFTMHDILAWLYRIEGLLADDEEEDDEG